jgi:membrane-associated protein
VIATVAVLAAIIGDSVGYEVGKHFGSRLLRTRIFAHRQQGIERGMTMLRNYGGRAVFLGRSTAFLRAVMPGLAGVARMPYGRFLVFNAAGGIVWALGFTLLGYLVGASYHEAENVAGWAGEAVLGLIIVVAVVLVIRHRRKERDPEPQAEPEPVTQPEPDPGVPR